ncbi:MAG: outer membrane lipoprotein-sorting protein [Oceanococcus sp.]
MKIVFVAAVGLLITSAHAQPSSPNAQTVLDCARDNVPERSFRQAALLKVTDDSGASREIRANFAGVRTDRGIMLNIGVKAPSDVAGTSVLLRRDDAGKESIKLYLPALRRVRTVTGSMASQGILGTDFSYRDIKDIFGSVREGEVTLLPEPEGGEDFHRLSIVPAAEQESPYQSLLVDIDKTHCVPMQLQFETAQQGITKIMTGDPETLHTLDEQHMLLRYTMRDVVKGSQTEMDLGPPEYDEKISRTAFNPSSFYNFNNRVEAPE